MSTAPDAVLDACPACAEAVLATDVFCEACGHQLAALPPVAPPEPDPAADPGDINDHSETDLERAAAASDRGRVRRRNEDAFTIRRTPGSVVAVVCDGVSASAAADRAARAASAAAADVLTAVEPGFDHRERLTAAVEGAQSAVARVPWPHDTPLAPPSCTLVAALWDGSTISVVSVGDSRAYWVGAGTAELLTTDDSWTEHQVAGGHLSAEEAARHPNAHAITHWIGADAPDEIPVVRSVQPDGPGHLVLCSDGLWNYTPTPDALAEVLRAQPGAAPIGLARCLVDHALDRGGHDNVTVAVIAITPGELP